MRADPDDGDAVDEVSVGRSPLRKMTLDRTFVRWASRSLFKAFCGGVFIGALWACTSLITIRAETTSGSSRFLLLISFLLDASFTFIATAVGLVAGITINVWSSVGKILGDGRRTILTRYLWAIMLIFVAVTVVNYYQIQLSANYLVNISALAYVVSATFAFSGAYHAYWLYGVMRKSDRREYYANRNSLSRTGSWLKRLPILDRTHVKFPFVWALVIVVGSIYITAKVIDLLPYQEHITQPVFAIVLSTLFGLWGVLRRAVDELNPWREQQMYPYWELDWNSSTRSPSGTSEEDQ